MSEDHSFIAVVHEMWLYSNIVGIPIGSFGAIGFYISMSGLSKMKYLAILCMLELNTFSLELSLMFDFEF